MLTWHELLNLCPSKAGFLPHVSHACRDQEVPLANVDHLALLAQLVYLGQMAK